MNRYIKVIEAFRTKTYDDNVAASGFTENRCECCGVAVTPYQVKWIQKIGRGLWTRETTKVIAVNYHTDIHGEGYSPICPRCEQRLARLTDISGDTVLASFAPPVLPKLTLKKTGTDAQGRQTYTDYRGFQYYNAGTEDKPDFYTVSLIGDDGVRVTEFFDITIKGEDYTFTL